MNEKFTGNFTQQEPIPDAAIEAAVAVMKSGRLHRYNVAAGDPGEVALLEQEFAAAMGAKYALAVASGGYALACALRAVGVKPGDKVLTNAFTLAPVPGAIASVGAVPVFVGVTEDLVIDLDDLAAKTGQADVLMLSHMRGHLCDMDRLMTICNAAGVKVIEDCAHTMGARWRGRLSGTDGVIGCYSTQTYKHLNSGEGGLMISDDPNIMARAVMLSGSYMLYDRHLAAPDPAVFEAIKYDTPNISGRMDNLRAAILRVQLRDLGRQCARWNDRYRVVEEGLRHTPGLTVIDRPEAEDYVGSSIQFLLLDWPEDQIADLLRRCLARGVELKWFGGAEPSGFTSRYDSWRYAPSPPMQATDRVLKGIVDMRLPLTFSLEDCAVLARIIKSEVGAVWQAG
ncbi:L-glutamine:2-deoxy-scyllo-inosose aminotransferase [Thalassovita gelatinovora]|uniref:L-glutamine:2-deoxy-scyllo-inosose aminotransferase n=1 Tax=Thalassovita gelatinovora TaxID=53501 RepID=A0A0P1FG02_THAGE|nr:DegT/DnrJ/EryC1/StrS family aminotransferase [Thalassovita gelatinovora]QIZ79853.1 aminotransferase [Thalassovita gelatinovora]CUH66949.1 L-glutamine:2-deoxy-scyllo-inosose aminotransferase [Thalassovita gelatinovora]SEQ45558.1 dTDP-4-amino-4,6-dideoxygalactose transaminase [Thalassovita gelatinovora]